MNNRIIECLMTVLNRIATYLSSPTHEPVSHEEPKVVRTNLTALERRQELLRHQTRAMLDSNAIHAIVVLGKRGGIGKSKCVLETVRERAEPVLFNSHVTALSLHSALYRHRHSGSVLIFDDCENITRNQACLGLLRSCLWNADGKGRLVTYNSTSTKLDVPASFYFQGKVILILNDQPRNNPCWKAVLSRAEIFHLDASNEDIIELGREIADQGYGDELTATECHSVVSHIEQNCGSREISLRLLEPAFQKVIYSRKNGCRWQDLIDTQLNELGQESKLLPHMGRPSEIEVLKDALNSHDTIKAAEEAFITATGKSRTSFYRLRRLLEQQDAAVQQTAKTTSNPNEEPHA